MGIRRKFTEAFENIGTGSADFLDKVTEGVRGFSCTLWNNYPKFITEGSNPVSSFARGFMNNTCAIGGGTVPGAPTPPFIGGQCDKAYYVTAFFYNSDTGQAACGATIEASTKYAFSPGYVTGRILSVGYVFDPGFGTNVLKVTYEHDTGSGVVINSSILGKIGTGSPILLDPPCANKPGSNSPGYALSDDLDSILIEAVDGIDDCGDPPSDYPPEVAPDPVTDFVTNINITNEDGANWTIPLIYAPVDFNFPLNFDLGGVKVVVDVGGIDFNFGTGDTPTELPPPVEDGQPHPLPSPGDNPPKIPCPTLPRPAPNPTDYDVDEKTETDPKEETIGDKLRFVKVEITVKPDNAKSQWGDGAPNVYYAGWFEFIGDGYAFPRRPIHFINSIYDAPEGATGYAYTVYQGFSAKATIYKLPE